MKLAFIIDDDPSFRLKAVEFLSKADYTIREFAFGWESIQELAENPDLIVLDHRLEQDESGLDYLLEIKSLKPQIPIVFLSGQEGLSMSELIVSNLSASKLSSTHRILLQGWNTLHCLN